MHTNSWRVRGLLYWAVVEIVRWAFTFCPVFGAAVGYLVDGVTGATSGFLVPVGPLVLVWLFGAR
jgi:hypothetical protein